MTDEYLRLGLCRAETILDTVTMAPTLPGIDADNTVLLLYHHPLSHLLPPLHHCHLESVQHSFCHIMECLFFHEVE